MADVTLEDHSEIGEGLLPQSLRLTRMIGLFDALIHGETQPLEQAFFDATGISVDTSTGVTLDRLGQLVKAIRWDGIGDSLYRKIIRARVYVNRSMGRPPDMYEVIRLFSGGTIPADTELIEEYPAAFRIEVFDFTVDSDGLFLARLLKDAKPAGVGFKLFVSENAKADMFQTSATFGTYEDDDDRGFGWSSLPLLGAPVAWSHTGDD